MIMRRLPGFLAFLCLIASFPAFAQETEKAVSPAPHARTYYETPRTLIEFLSNSTRPRPADMPTMQAFSWQGMHAGVNFGFGVAPGTNPWGVGAGSEEHEAYRVDAGWLLPKAPLSGLIGGVQVGYDQTFGRLVTGVEADWQAGGLSGGQAGFGQPQELKPFVDNRRAIDWFGTLRGRLGYALTPGFMAYATGGLAYGGGANLLRYMDSAGNVGESVNNPTRAGFAAGGGIEWAISPTVSMKLEYLMLNLGRSPAHLAFTENEKEEEASPRFVSMDGYPNRFEIFRAGLNYRFNFKHSDEKNYGDPNLYLYRSGDKSPEISTHYIFGFTYGTDIETEGRGEILNITKVNAGKRPRTLKSSNPVDVQTFMREGNAGIYSMIDNTLEFEHTISEDFQYAIGVMGAHPTIFGVEDIPNRHNVSLRGVLGEARYIMLRRTDKFPVGVSLHVEPQWGHISNVTGWAETLLESDNRLCVDAELLPKKLYAALNIMYTPQIFREITESKWIHSAYHGVMGAMTYFVAPKVGVGGGFQLLNRWVQPGTNVTDLQGTAFYLGPQAYVRVTNQLFLTVAWSRQLAGHAIHDPRPLDLANFTRDMARIQFGGEF